MQQIQLAAFDRSSKTLFVKGKTLLLVDQLPYVCRQDMFVRSMMFLQTRFLGLRSYELLMVYFVWKQATICK